MKTQAVIAVIWTAWSVLAATSALGQEAIASPSAPDSSKVGSVYLPPPTLPGPPYSAPVGDPSGVADTETIYTLDDLLQLAAANNPTLLQARVHISAELGKALEAGLYPNPRFSYSAEQIFVRSDTSANTPGEFQGGILEQRFVTAGKLRLSRQKYLQRAQIAEHLAIAQQFRVCNDVRIHFYRALAAERTLTIRRELLKAAEDGAVTVRESYNLGEARRPDVRRADVALQRARLDVLNAENVYDEEFRQLTSLVGVPVAAGSVNGDLFPECPPLTFVAALERLIAESPELAAARTKLTVDQITVRREEVQWVPDVVVRGGSGYNFESKQTTAVAGVTVEIPLYDRNQGTVQQARADLARQRQEIARVELELRNRLAGVYQEYATRLQHANEYERIILPELKAAYAELLQSYKDDRVAWPDVLMAQRDYFDAQLTQVDNLLHARTQEVLIYGYLLHDGLKAAPDVTPPGHIDAVPKPR